ncbi:MAG: hypothetical protein Q4A43_01820 [Coriobacteriia bacterium]|nr:hypothetical protein [Coriobacteriia bacterium]
MATKTTLFGVPETMLQTLGRGAIHNEKAADLVRSLDYDFSAAKKYAAAPQAELVLLAIY